MVAALCNVVSAAPAKAATAVVLQVQSLFRLNFRLSLFSFSEIFHSYKFYTTRLVTFLAVICLSGGEGIETLDC